MNSVRTCQAVYALPAVPLAGEGGERIEPAEGRQLTRFLSPKSIAFIGGHECDVAIARTRALGFEGKIWAVHPKRSELAGISCIQSVDEIDGEPDAAFI